MAQGSGRDDANRLTPFVSSLAATWLVERPDERHRHVEGTLVSADLSGFTALSERLASRGKVGAEELTLTVNLCFTVLIDAARAEGGDVLKFGGDALLLWFEGPDHRRRAATATVRMQRCLDAPNLTRAGLRMSVGAASGGFHFFLVGHPHRDLVVCGPAATEVTKLEGAADPGEVLVAPDTAAGLDAGWLTSSRDGGVLLDLAVELGGEPGGTPPALALAESRLDVLVPERVREQLDALAGAGGEHRLATIGFLGIDGTDERLGPGGDPDALADDIDELLTELQASASRYGVVFLYSDIMGAGVKLILTAGAPVTSGDDEEAMLRAAREVVGRSWGGRLRGGVHRGHVFAGFLGSPTRSTYTVMGDPVNLAARLLGKAAPGELMASDDAVRRSRAVFDYTEIEPFLVKGKTQPVHAHKVGDLTADRVESTGESLPLVGREAELDMLIDAVGLAVSGEGAVVEVVGDAGIGKTRLVRAMADDPRLVVRLVTECQPYDSLTPYAAVRPLIRRVCDIDQDVPPDEAGAQLASWVERNVPALTPWVPLLAVPIGADVAPTIESDAIAPQYQTARIHASVIELLEAALRSTTMLLVEDIYFIDDASLGFLRALSRAVEGHPWVLCMTRRPEGHFVLDDSTGGTVVKLVPLSPAEARKLAELASSDVAVSDRDLDVVADRSGGNPLFALELVSATAAGGDMSQLPETIERLVATRIDQLAASDRMLLRHAAIIGRTFTLRVLGEVLGAIDAAGADPRSWSRMSEFVEVESQGRYHFRHALFRDVAYEGMPFRRRRELHGLVGDILVRTAPDGEEASPDLLSLHFSLGGRHAETWRYAVAAADGAQRSHAMAEAADLYRRALDSGRYAGVGPEAISGVAESLGDVFERLGRYVDASASYARARRAGCVERHRQARLLRKEGWMRNQMGRYGQAMRWYRRALAVLGDVPADENEQGELIDVYNHHAATYYGQGRYSECGRWAHKAVDMATAFDEPHALARAYQLLQISGAFQRQAGEDYGFKAAELFASVGDLVGEGNSLNNLGVGAYFDGRWADSLELYERSGNVLERAGYVVGGAMAKNNIAEILSDRGDYEPASELFAQVVRVSTAANFPLLVAAATSNLGRVSARQGDTEIAMALLEDALRMFEEMGAESFTIETLARVAECHVIAGRSEQALDVVATTLSRSGEGEPDPTSLVLLHRVAGYAHLQKERLVRARASFETSLRLAEGTKSTFEAAGTLHGLALLSKATGDAHGEAYEAESVRGLEQLGVKTLPRIPVPF